jgi:hypothetical protein
MRTALHCITPEVIAKGFEICGISNEVDGTDGYVLWNDTVEVGNVWSECEEDERADCEDGDRDTDW